MERSRNQEGSEIPAEIDRLPNIRGGKYQSDHADILHVGLRSLVDAEFRNGRGFLWLPILIGTGVILQIAFAQTPVPLIILGAGIVFCLAILSWKASHWFIHVPALIGLALLIGASLVVFEIKRTDTVIVDSSVTTDVVGKVVRYEPDHRGFARYLIDVRETHNPRLKRAPTRVQLLARAEHRPVETGQMMKGRARLSPPSGPAILGGFDFAYYNYFRNVGAIGFFYKAPVALPSVGFQEIAVRDRMALNLRQLRETIARRILSVLGPQQGAIASALITGDRRAIPPDIVETLRVTGLAHILAISGLHMGLAAACFVVFFRTILSVGFLGAQEWPVKKLAAVGAILTTTAYLLISGGSVSATRAWVMTVILLIAVLWDRPALTMRNVAIAAIVVMAFRPSAILTPGFQMSFAAVAALIACYSAWTQYRAQQFSESAASGFSPVHQLLKGLVAIFITSLVAGAATSVFAAFHFHRISGFGIVANLAAMPVVSLIVMPAGLVAMLAMPFGLDALPLALMGQGLQLLTKIAAFAAELGGPIQTGRIPLASFMTAATGFILLCLLRTRLIFCSAVPLIASLIIFVLAAHEPRPVLLISEDAKVVAFLGEDGFSTHRKTPSKFVFEQWQQALVVATRNSPVELRPSGHTSKDHLLEGIRVAHEQPGQFFCLRKNWCLGILPKTGQVVTIVDDLAHLGLACDVSDIVITPARIRLAQCYSGAWLFSGRNLARRGAIEIYLPDKSGSQLQLRSTISGQIKPWTVHRYYDWRSDSFAFEKPKATAW